MLSRFLPLATKVCAATFVLTAAFATLPKAHAQILSQFTFGTVNNAATTGVGYSPTTVGANVGVSPITLTAGTTATMNINLSLYTSQVLIFNPQDVTTAATAVATNKSFEFTITPTSGFQASLSSLTFGVARAGASTPRGYVVRSSRDGFSTNIATADVSTQRPTLTSVSIPLTGVIFQNTVTATTFRVYSYSSVAATFLDYDNVTVNGTTAAVAVVPEASTLMLFPLAGVLGAMLVVRRKK